MSNGPKSQFVLVPREGVRARTGVSRNLMRSMPHATSTTEATSTQLSDLEGQPEIDIIDTVHEDGPKLVELDESAAAAVNTLDSPLRAIPVVYYDRPDPRPTLSGGFNVAGGTPSNTIVIKCQDKDSGAPVAGAEVIAFTDFATKSGDSGTTDAAGETRVTLGGATTIERLYVYAPAGYWSAFREQLSVQPTIDIDLAPVEFNFQDAVRFYYDGSHFDPTVGVRVGVIDSGVGPHRDLNLGGGRNTVTGEPGSAFEDGDVHGTHVAGLIGANGAPGAGFRGVAPGIELRSYRVFGLGANGASNYSILKAMIFSADDECDIINLSLGGGPADPIVREAVADARLQGILVVVAAGNDGRKPVNYPARYAQATAVSAMGREGSFPTGSLDESSILRPPDSQVDAAEFIAKFSNQGTEIDLTAPGVGVLSTLPNNQFGPMSGTSMAAPVAAGAAASLLSKAQSVYQMPRDGDRSAAIEKLLLTSCQKRGFGAIYEGFGLPEL